jgi:FkbM family methyltransferase
MSKIEITPEGYAVLDDDRISCSQEVRLWKRIDHDIFGSLDVCHPYWRIGSTVIDVGAHIGTWSVIMGLTVGSQGKLIAIEADPEVFACLSYNVNRHPEITNELLNCAVWDESGTVQFIRNVENRGCSAVNITNIPCPSPHIEMSVEAVRLDDLPMSDVSFIKMDVEGAELRCLKGGENLIKTHRPVMFIEALDHAQIQYGGSQDELYDWIRSLGYDLTRYPLGYGDDSHDVLCIPR